MRNNFKTLSRCNLSKKAAVQTESGARATYARCISEIVHTHVTSSTIDMTIINDCLYANHMGAQRRQPSRRGGGEGGGGGGGGK